MALLSLPALPTFALRASAGKPALPAHSVLAAGPVVKGPAHGALVIVGGGKVGTDILTRMFDLAGGKDAPLVVIPDRERRRGLSGRLVRAARCSRTSARPTSRCSTRRTAGRGLRGVRQADHHARIVWFVGGRQWRLVDSYLHTRTQREIENVLERGGVVAGSSAGASILASYMVRGARENNFIMMAPGYEEGFGLIKGVAIDQHMLTRNRQDDLEEVVAKHPDVLGIGLDESTAIIVQGQQFEVVGASKVAIHDGRIVKGAQERNGGKKKYFFMGPGEKYDLTKLERIGKPKAERTALISRRAFLGGMMARRWPCRVPCLTSRRNRRARRPSRPFASTPARSASESRN